LGSSLNAKIVLVGGPKDGDIVSAVAQNLQQPHTMLVGQLSFGQIAALASLSQLYIGNDTGLTHLAAAAGAKTVMILGPSDPVRYAPFTPNAIALWKPAALKSGGVAAGIPTDWDWSRNGISVEEVITKVIAFAE